MALRLLPLLLLTLLLLPLLLLLLMLMLMLMPPPLLLLLLLLMLPPPPPPLLLLLSWDHTTASLTHTHMRKQTSMHVQEPLATPMPLLCPSLLQQRSKQPATHNLHSSVHSKARRMHAWHGACMHPEPFLPLPCGSRPSAALSTRAGGPMLPCALTPTHLGNAVRKALEAMPLDALSGSRGGADDLRLVLPLIRHGRCAAEPVAAACCVLRPGPMHGCTDSMRAQVLRVVAVRNRCEGVWAAVWRLSCAAQPEPCHIRVWVCSAGAGYAYATV